MRGVPQRVNPVSNIVCDDRSKWSQKIFACASTVKATIKTVSLVYNNSRSDSSFNGFGVKDINDKVYTRSNEIPLWGVENTGNKYNISQLNLVWGLLSKQYEGHSNTPTVCDSRISISPARSAPTASLGAYAYKGDSNIPRSDFSIGALQAAYNVKIFTTALNSALSPTAGGIRVDYTGSSNIAM
ncbi:hypothetical protein QBC37DRAFT_375727 [Rhypophila decipiens]|uniref:Uncharacterized protein n=1 Tax=Rhypophila decipiens TaxID=261697 RepID=A0AAN6Y373_9PEZI|nr:hypothetical protein QBC37DRAFT_375727 [Rhypophila decipiens]